MELVRKSHCVCGFACELLDPVTEGPFDRAVEPILLAREVLGVCLDLELRGPDLLRGPLQCVRSGIRTEHATACRCSSIRPARPSATARCTLRSPSGMPAGTGNRSSRPFTRPRKFWMRSMNPEWATATKYALLGRMAKRSACFSKSLCTMRVMSEPVRTATHRSSSSWARVASPSSAHPFSGAPGSATRR